MTVAVDGGPVVAHAQAFADEINRRFGFTHIMTYPGHEPDQQHALDNFSTRDKMLQLAEWCTHDDVIDRYGIDYVIFNVDESTVGGEIYNREISRSWRHMPDRGSPTQNHHDHVHVSFNPTAAGPFGPSPVPEEDDMPIAFVETILPGEGKTIGVPPCHSGGAGWGQVWGSLSVDNFGEPPTPVRVMVKDETGDPTKWYSPVAPTQDTVNLQSGRSFGWGFKKGDQCVSIINKGKHPVSFMCEAVKA